MKKQIIVSALIVSVVATVASGVFASVNAQRDPCERLTATGPVRNELRCALQTDRATFLSGAKSRRDQNVELRDASRQAIESFRSTHSGAMKEAIKSLSGADREALKSARSQLNEIRDSMSGKTLEERMALRSSLKTAQQGVVNAAFKNNTELRNARLAVLSGSQMNADTIVRNQSMTQSGASSLASREVDMFIAQATQALSGASDEKKTKIVELTAKKIEKVESKNILAAVKTALIARLTTFKNSITQ